MRRLARGLLACLTVSMLSVSSAGCWLLDQFKYTASFSEEGNASVTYVAPSVGSYSGPATVAMWNGYYGANGSYTQTDYYNNLVSYGGVSDPAAFGSTIYATSSWAAALETYDFNSTYNGGRDGSFQGAADLAKSIDAYHPGAVFMYGNSFGMVNTFGASRECNGWGQCQPSINYLSIHLPGNGGADQLFAYPDLHYYWNDGYGEGLAWYPVGASSYLAMTNSDWADVDANATTYYGDPNPPEPDCDFCGDPNGGDDEDPPENRMMAISGGTSSTKDLSTANQVAFSNPSSRDEIVKDFVAGVKRTHMNTHKGFESLTLEDGKWTVASVVKVKSLGEFPDYFILSLADTSGRIVAKGTVHVDGLVGVVSRVKDNRSEVFDIGSARSAVGRAGLNLESTPERVYMLGSVAADCFDPMFLATANGGRKILIGSNGSVYSVAQELSGKMAKTAGANRVHASRGMTWVLQTMAAGAKK